MSFVDKVVEAAQDVVELVQLRVRVDALEKQVSALQTESMTQRKELDALTAAQNKPA